MSSTIRSCDPSVTSTTPTVSPSRRTVARSQTAAISIIRWEMKITDRSPPRWWPMTSRTRSVEVRGQGRGHLVEHEDVGLDREGPGEVDDPERGKRQPPRQARQVEILEAELADPVPERLLRRLGEAQVGAQVQVGDERRLLVDGDDASAAGLGGVVDGALPAPHGDGPGVRVRCAGQDLDERALAGAVGAHERVDLARAHGQRGGLQRHDGTIGLRDARGLEQEVGGGGGHCPRQCSAGDAGMPASPVELRAVRRGITPRRGPCRRWPAQGCRSSSPRS